MDKTTIIAKEVTGLKNPILIEGLPGIGLVGKLAADHMIKELKAEKIAELYSPHFPHQVLMLKKGILRMLKNKFYLWRNPDPNGSDVIILIGDVQAITSEAQFEVCGAIIDYFKKLGGNTIYTLGGYGTGKVVEKPKVFGSATHKDIMKDYEKHGVIFGEANGSIIGAAGLLLGLGKLDGMKGVCLMGETHGGYVDAKSAQSVLEMLSKIIGTQMDLSKLSHRAKESERFMKKMESEAKKQQNAMAGGVLPLNKDDISYIR
ncbi:MAG: proteasome assembly chaperone family protein [Candidatus Micrarchaeota archaeon]